MVFSYNFLKRWKSNKSLKKKKTKKVRRKQWKKEKKKEEKRAKRAARGGEPCIPMNGSLYKRHAKPVKAIHVERMNRARYKRVEIFIILMKTIVHSNFLESQIKAYAAMYLSSLSRHSSITRHNNICLDTGYRKSVQVFTRMNRLAMRERLSYGMLSGIETAKW